MSAEIPPTDYSNGMNFNKSFYQSSTDDYLTASTGKKLFLSYPISQGSEIFSSNITLQSTLTDSSSSVGTAGQYLSSTSTGINWITLETNAYSTFDASILPYTLPIPSSRNLFVLITGTASGTLTLPTTGITNGTSISIKNSSTASIFLNSSFILFTSLNTQSGALTMLTTLTFNAYFNGSVWVETTIRDKITSLNVLNTLTLSSGLTTNSIVQASSGDIKLYDTSNTQDIFIGENLPNPYTIRLCNTTAGTSGGSVHCCSVGFDGININNAVSASLNSLRVCNNQTTGTLFLGGGSSNRTTGPILIGCDSAFAGGINIGTGTGSSTPTANTINLGSGTITTIVKGTLTVNDSLTVSAGNISLTTASGTITAPSTGFLIGPYKNAATATASINTTGTITGTSLVLGTGNITSCGTITASGLITADGGIQLPSGDTLNVLGSISGSGNITTSGDISVSGTGSISTAAGGSIETNAYESRTTTSNMTIGASMTNAANILIGSNSLIKMKSPSTTNTGSTPSTQAATNMTIYGALMYSEITAAYTIPSNINRDFYIGVAGAGGYTVTLPAVAIHQILHIRHYSSTNVNLTTPLSTTKIYPIQGSIYTQTFNMTGNQVQNLYCNGTDWIGF